MTNAGNNDASETQPAVSSVDDIEGNVTTDEDMVPMIPPWLISSENTATTSDGGGDRGNEPAVKRAKVSTRQSQRRRKEKFTINAGRGKRGTERIQWIES